MPFSVESAYNNQKFRNATAAALTAARKLRRVRSTFSPIITKSLTMHNTQVINALKRRHNNPYASGRRRVAGVQKGRLNRRSGELLRSLRQNVRGNATSGFVSTVTAGSFKAAIHEQGAKVSPRSKEYLTIPLRAALTARGIPKKPNARAWPHTFVQRGRDRKLYIFQRRRGGIIPLYLLKRRVNIPRRFGMAHESRIRTVRFRNTLVNRINREFRTGTR